MTPPLLARHRNVWSLNIDMHEEVEEEEEVAVFLVDLLIQHHKPINRKKVQVKLKFKK